MHSYRQFKRAARRFFLALTMTVPWLGLAYANDSPVDVTCQIVDVEETENIADGQMVIEVISLSSTQLSNVMIRLAPETLGAVTGDVRVAQTLAPGQSYSFSGVFQMPSDLLSGDAPMVWEIRYGPALESTVLVTSDPCSM